MSTGRTTTTFSASAYRKVGQKAAAALCSERDAERAERKAEHDAKQGQIRKRVIEFATYLFGQLPAPEDIEKLPMLAGSTLIGIARPPSKEEMEVEIDGRVETAKVPKYPATETHFAGYDAATGELADPEKDGHPLVALLQGFRSKDNGVLGKSDPKTLPDGMTAIDRLNAMLIASLGPDEDIDSCPCVRLHWNARPRGTGGAQEDGRLEIRLVWDLGAWEGWLAKRGERAGRVQARRGGGASGRGGASGGEASGSEKRTVTLDEHMARMGGRVGGGGGGGATASEAGSGSGGSGLKDGETFTVVRSRRRAGRGGE